jgi:hypothetical protein
MIHSITRGVLCTDVIRHVMLKRLKGKDSFWGFLLTKYKKKEYYASTKIQD